MAASSRGKAPLQPTQFYIKTPRRMIELVQSLRAHFGCVAQTNAAAHKAIEAAAAMGSTMPWPDNKATRTETEQLAG